MLSRLTPTALLLVGLLAGPLAGLLAAATPAGAAPRTPESSEARLPLAEVLRLRDAVAEAAAGRLSPPPLAATLDRVELTARIAGDTAALSADIQATVLSSLGWVVLPIVQLDDNLQVAAIPELKGAALSVVDGHLCLVTNTTGQHRLSLSFVARARVVGERRSVVCEVGRATVATLRILHDQATWQLVGPGAPRADEGEVLLPTGSTFTFAWERRADAVAEAAPTAATPEIESVVTRAVASTVTTLDGARITRLACELRFQGAKEIRFSIAEGQVVDKAYVNRQLVPFEQAEGRVALGVRPQEVGGTTGTVELVLTSTDPPYPLSGKLAFALPQCSWVVHELGWTLHLPEVFNYTWTGGSLQPAEPLAMTFSYAIPVAGKALSFRQFLITASAPRLAIDHDIDLTGHYHCPVATARR